MSRTAVSELNARMSLDITPLEQAVPRATALLKRLSSVQAEAFATQSGGPDIQAMTERMRAASKQAGFFGMESGEVGQFINPQAEAKFAQGIADAHEESLRRRALREKAFRDEQINAIAKVAADERAYAAMAEQAEARRMEALRAREAYEQSIYDQKLRQAATDNAIATAEQSAIRNRARDSAAVFQAEERAAQERLAVEQQIADLRRKQAQARATEAFDRANPFKQQVMAVEELNKLLAVRRNLQRGTVEFAQAELAVTQQIARVRSIRDSLTAGPEAFRRLGNTAADSQKGMSRFGLAMQQAGYQVQDFAVQVTSGTNVLVAFSQQASQLLGFFGGMKGAIAGAALAGGILAYRLASGSEQMERQLKAVGDLAEAFKQLERSQTDFSRRGLSEGAMAGALEKDAENARRKALEASQEVTRARQLIQQVTMEGMSTSQAQGGGLLGENLPYLVNYMVLWASGATNAQKGTAALEQSAKDLAEALAKATAAQEAAANAREAYNKELAAIQKDISLVGESEYERVVRLKQEYISLVELGADLLDIKRAEAAVTQASYSYEQQVTAQRKANAQIGEDSFDKLARLRKELWEAEDPLQTAQVSGELKQAELAVKQLAEGYLDQLDPLRKQRRELELIAKLEKENLLTQEQSALLRFRMEDARQRALRLPAAFEPRGSAQSSGGFVGGGGQTLIDLNKRMLAALDRISTNTLMMAGAN